MAYYWSFLRKRWKEESVRDAEEGKFFLELYITFDVLHSLLLSQPYSYFPFLLILFHPPPLPCLPLFVFFTPLWILSHRVYGNDWTDGRIPFVPTLAISLLLPTAQRFSLQMIEGMQRKRCICNYWFPLLCVLHPFAEFSFFNASLFPLFLLSVIDWEEGRQKRENEWNGKSDESVTGEWKRWNREEEMKCILCNFLQVFFLASSRSSPPSPPSSSSTGQWSFDSHISLSALLSLFDT